MVNWQKKVKPKIIEFLDDYKKEKIIPTLRAIFYLLVSVGEFPNTDSYYTSLSSYLVGWRKDPSEEKIPINCIVDETRTIINNQKPDKTPSEFIDREFLNLRAIIENYKELVPRWRNQPNYVEIWVEKSAIAVTIDAILKDKVNGEDGEDREISIVPMRGNPSLSIIYECAEQLKKIKLEDPKKNIFIKYFGDYDTTGCAIDGDIKDKLKICGMTDYNFERISITKKQIKKYNLRRAEKKDKISIEELQEKLKRDSKWEIFAKNNGGEVFQVEIDAMLAFVPDAFKAMILESVDKHFDEDIYRKMRKSIPSEKKILGLVKEKTQEFYQDL